MKTKYFKFTLAISCFLVFGTTIFSIYANSAGTNADPLVSKSYVDSKIAELKTLIGTGTGTGTVSQVDGNESFTNEIMSRVEAVYGTQINDIKNRISNQTTGNQSTDTSSQIYGFTYTGATYAPVYLTIGQKLIGAEGTEIIVRSGEAIGYVSGENGISNITTGKDVFNGGNIGLNNLLIVPRSDGRGIVAITDEVWTLVKGNYQIQAY